MTQTNSATAEQSAAASEELSSQAELLKDMVERFNLKGQRHSARQPSKPQQTRNANKPPERRQAVQRPQIALNDKEFGKY